MTPIDKKQLAAALRERLVDTLRSITESQRATQGGATHEESRPENAKDTRSTEASYLARGLAKRVAELRVAVTALEALEIRCFAEDEPAALTALVELVNEDGSAALIWLVPAGGGEVLDADGHAVRCATPTSPLGRSLMARVAGDEVILELPKGRKPVEIASIR